ncbi:hypothetical protein Clacol_003424 [Clathrus columnatus]|uniref:Cytochrome P450 n=1 Tax=Clathrus columnatus TaxID=1419009 RepID=A0AAV5A6B6_9AGAM|nr:hypothetical protein Clacol_003424 [Clathrus columnatus]
MHAVCRVNSIVGDEITLSDLRKSNTYPPVEKDRKGFQLGYALPTSFEKTIPDYRKRILLALFKGLVIPPLITTLILWRQPGVLRSLISFISIPITITLRSRYSVWKQDNEARRLNAKVIPRVQGKLPGNLDIVRRIMKSLRQDYILQGFADLLREHNTTILNTRFFWDDQIISMDEGVMQFVFSTGFSHFEKGILWHERIDKLLGTGLFNAEGAAWKKGRAMARPFFSKDRISDVDIFERTSSKTLDLISARSNKTQPIDTQDLVARFTLDSASEFLFGIQLDTLSRPLTEPGKVKLGPKGSIPIDRTEEFDVFTEAFERVAVIVTRRGTQGTTWPLMELTKDLTEEPIQIIMDWLEPLVKVAVEKRNSMKGLQSAMEDSVFLDFLASQTDGQCGTYSTATLLTFIIYLFAMHPEVCEKLREEILTTFGPDQSPSYDKLKGLKYLHAVFNETLRLFPSAPLIARISGDVPLVIPTAKGSIYFPRRTQVMNISLLLHRRHDLWGEDADEFCPERWFDKKTLAKCIGQEFAFNETAYFLVRLLQRFKAFKLAPQYQPEGSLPNPAWEGRPGRQSIEKITPAINMTVHSKLPSIGSGWRTPSQVFTGGYITHLYISIPETMIIVLLLIWLHSLVTSCTTVPLNDVPTDKCLHDIALPTVESDDTLRSSLEILWSCLATTFAVTWISVHPNMSPPGEKVWWITWRRFKLMFWALVAPEFVVLWAWRQRQAARKIAREVRILAKERNQKYGHDWTITHGHFFQMGGFLLQGSDDKLNVLYFEQFQSLVGKIIDIPSISIEEINDKSKSDPLGKSVATLQILWFIIQVIARLINHLDITQVELTTAALACLNATMYILWWNKPLDVRCSVIISPRPPNFLNQPDRIPDSAICRQDPDFSLQIIERRNEGQTSPNTSYETCITEPFLDIAHTIVDNLRHAFKEGFRVGIKQFFEWLIYPFICLMIGIVIDRKSMLGDQTPIFYVWTGHQILNGGEYKTESFSAPRSENFRTRLSDPSYESIGIISFYHSGNESVLIVLTSFSSHIRRGDALAAYV